ncbi:hypothetical protein [Methylomicrobium sp. Wu6]|uniref:hypothetical protein n=1 Tax=Methylomicrobium sp. Wu6 TaxID=3107928 RepID=UPI002DD68C30|nr:hypothetical protein [Methylomicrobium sp. Wu6]MEC4748969.1 hypothetical protein [Methylomicrobium sp. Wu6]
MQLQFIKNLLPRLKQCLLPAPGNPLPFWACINEGILVFGAWLAKLSGIWQKYDFFFDLIKCSRVTLFILAFAAVFLFLPNSQGAELTIRLSTSLGHALVFLFGVFLWAFQAWIGTRKVLEMVEKRVDPTGEQLSGWHYLSAALQEKTWLGRLTKGKNCCAKAMESESGWVEHWPRILGMLVFLVSLLALWMPVKHGRIAFFSPHGLLIAADFGLAILFYALTMGRRKWIQAVCAKKGIRIEEHWAQLDNLHASSGAFTIVYVLVLLILATFAPVWLGFTFGAAGIAVLGFGSLTASGNFIIRSIVTRNSHLDYGEATQFPVLSILFIVAAVFSFFNDNHGLRLLDPMPQRPKLEAFAEQWAQRNQPGANQVRPMIFVAAAGGGIRASHWTAAVLTYLADNNPKFAESVFAISGVSGGSVGAAFYSALLKQNIDCAKADGKDCLQSRARDMLSHDFLGPTISALLFNDLLQRFLPFGILPDRQKALETGWEKAWSRAFDGSAGMAEPYSSTWNKPGGANKWLPLLLLNNTHMETGRKMITSPFPLDSTTFADDVDLIELLEGSDMPLSVAAGNSARFTYVSPPGTLPYDGGWFEMREDNGHVLDGGYFENNGAITLQELLQALETLKGGDGKSFFERYAIKPIVVVITNDNQLVCGKGDDGLVKCPKDVWIKPQPEVADAQPAVTDFNGKFTRLTDNNGANETLGPILGILNSREGHGIAGVKNLIAWVDECGRWPQGCHLSESAKPEFFHFRIDLNKGENPPALGWVLSKDSEKLIWNKIKAPDGKNGSQHNHDEAQRLLGLL